MTSLPPVTVLCTAPSGRWAHLDSLGFVTGLEYGFQYPGGAWTARCQVSLPPSGQYMAVIPGAAVEVVRGASTVWRGRIETIERGEPWSLEFSGNANVGAVEPTLQSGNLNAIVDAHIAAGLPWKRNPDASGATQTLTPEGSRTWDGSNGGVGQTPLGDVLSQILLRDDRRWAVDLNGNLRSSSDPVDPSMILRIDGQLQASLNDYATVVILRYTSASDPIDTAAKRTVQVTDAAGLAKFGRKVHTVNAGDSRIASAIAQAWAQTYLNRVKPRLTTTQEFTVAKGQLTTATGAPVDLASVQAHGRLARLQAITTIHNSLLLPQQAIDMLIGTTEYAVDDGTLTVGPDTRTDSWADLMFGARGGGRIQ